MGGARVEREREALKVVTRLLEHLLEMVLAVQTIHIFVVPVSRGRRKKFETPRNAMASDGGIEM